MLLLILSELTVREVIADLPRDAGALVVLLLLLAFAGFIWHGSRSGGTGPVRTSAGEAAGPRPVSHASESAAAVPEPEAVFFDPASLSTAPDLRRHHPQGN